jgi:hypothetical protein
MAFIADAWETDMLLAMEVRVLMTNCLQLFDMLVHASLYKSNLCLLNLLLL